MLSELYAPWACIRNDLFPPIIGLLSTLDTIDFNLYVREEDIPKEDNLLNWDAIMENGILHFDRFSRRFSGPFTLLLYLHQSSDKL